MRVVMITPGSGDHFYCENCRRDLDTVRALRSLGHDAVLVPLYLPIGAAADAAPVFYGAVNVFLEQTLPGYRRLPRSWRRFLDAMPVLRFAADRAGSTRARGLDDLTLSVLRGEDGRQADELDRLTAWLAREQRPDVVHLSNALLLGLARRIRADLGVPVVCSLQDEDTWVDVMAPDSRQRIWDCMADRARDVDLFLPVSQYYAGKMRPLLGLDAGRLRVVCPGVETATRQPQSPPPQPVIGYYSRLSESLGLNLLVEAFLLLRARPEFASLRLTAAGGMTADDAANLQRLRDRLQAAGAADHVTLIESFDPEGSRDRIGSFTLLSVPVPAGEAFGLFVIEALSYGVPVVQPRCGAFPEVLERTGGGVLCDPGSAPALAEAMAPILRQPERRAALSAAGLAGVRRHFDLHDHTVPGLLAAYAAVGPA